MQTDANTKADALSKAGIACRLPSVFKRQKDITTFAAVQDILAQAIGPSTKLQKLKFLLQNAETVGGIISGGPSASSRQTQVSTNASNQRILYKSAAAAECATLTETFERRRAEQAAREREDALKEERKKLDEAKRMEKKMEAAVRRHEAEQEKEVKRRRVLERKEQKTREREERQKAKVQEADWKKRMKERQNALVKLVPRTYSDGGKRRKRTVAAARVRAEIVFDVFEQAVGGQWSSRDSPEGVVVNSGVSQVAQK